MEVFKIAGTAKTPTISLSPDGLLVLEGRSIPENSIDFYRPVMEWLEGYAKKPSAKTVLQVKLEYFNTSSSKCILDLFKKLHAISEAGSETSIQWHYHEEDEDMHEAGEDYREIVSIPFELVSYPS